MPNNNLNGRIAAIAEKARKLYIRSMVSWSDVKYQKLNGFSVGIDNNTRNVYFEFGPFTMYAAPWVHDEAAYSLEIDSDADESGYLRVHGKTTVKQPTVQKLLKYVKGNYEIGDNQLTMSDVDELVDMAIKDTIAILNSPEINAMKNALNKLGITESISNSTKNRLMELAGIQNKKVIK